MRLNLNKKTNIPIYKQIVNFYKKAIQSGQIPPGTQLPATRRLANELGINRLTVDHAYENLKIDGLIETIIGSGTFTLTPPAEQSTCTSNQIFHEWNNDLQNQNHLYNLTSYPPFDGINFSSGSGDPALFPYESFRKTLQTLMRKQGYEPLTYGDPQGYLPLRQSIGQILTSQGISTEPNKILITSGSQQAIALCAQVYLQPGDTVFVERPTYAAALNLFQSMSLNIESIKMDAEGMVVDELEEKIKIKLPKLIYTVPTYHNPTGTCLSTVRRYQLINLAAHYNIPIIEDDYVGDLHYDGHTRPTLKSLDQHELVIFIGTFSKMLMPGIRVGYVTGHENLIKKLTRQKYLTDLASNNLLQHALYAYVTIGRYQQHLNRACRVYKKRRDIIHFSLKQHLANECEWVFPNGGFYIWLKIPSELNTQHLLSQCKQNGLNFAPGYLFFDQALSEQSYIRLNFAAVHEDDIPNGIQKLAELIKNHKPNLNTRAFSG
ncbi:MAG: GntR family transcriptional regulator [Anaerolineaceae bacterium]|nr:GntR family transcriptional regulator [Anaerolineaceae bacterium]